MAMAKNRNVSKSRNGRKKSRTSNIQKRRVARTAAQSAERGKKTFLSGREMQSPSIIPEMQQPELMVEQESTNSKKSELYMLNEAEFIRAFGWWGLH
jgi:hypothetical protein